MWIAITTPQTAKLTACSCSSGPPPCPTMIRATPLPKSVSVETTRSGASRRKSSRGGPSTRYGLLFV